MITINRVDQGIGVRLTNSFSLASGIISSALIWNKVIFDSANVWDAAHPERITPPSWAKYIYVCGHATFPANVTGSVPGFCRIHLFRNGQPTAEDFYYHTSFYNPFNIAGGSLLSFKADTGIWIPILNPNEYWDMRLYQSSGQPININGPIDEGETWFAMNFTQSLKTGA